MFKDHKLNFFLFNLRFSIAICESATKRTAKANILFASSVVFRLSYIRIVFYSIRILYISIYMHAAAGEIHVVFYSHICFVLC